MYSEAINNVSNTLLINLQKYKTYLIYKLLA